MDGYDVDLQCVQGGTVELEPAEIEWWLSLAEL